MTIQKGFTLTEVLLAVMIVAIIGVALASLTTAATREAGTGQGRGVLRNNLSMGMRQIRADFQAAKYVNANFSPNINTDPNTNRPYALASILRPKESDPTEMEVVTYCFKRGTGQNTTPSSAKVGGTIYRVVSPDKDTTKFTDKCSDAALSGLFSNPVLTNVKYIPYSAGYKYDVPRFENIGGGAVVVNLIVEIPGSKPVINEAVEEIFFLPSPSVEFASATYL